LGYDGSFGIIATPITSDALGGDQVRRHLKTFPNFFQRPIKINGNTTDFTTHFLPPFLSLHCTTNTNLAVFPEKPTNASANIQKPLQET
jgi:hypothetical protein